MTTARKNLPAGAVSERKRAANRANARKSTGPRTAAGKARVARNALRHGLSRPAGPDPAVAGAIETFARELCGLAAGAAAAGEAADPALQWQFDLARRIAVAQDELVRVYRARHELLTRAIVDPAYRASRKIGARKRRYDGCSPNCARRTHLDADLEAEIATLAPGPGRTALIFAYLSREIAAFDRYRDRAMSRRESAVWDFVKARDQAAGGAIDASSRPAWCRPCAEQSVPAVDAAVPDRNAAVAQPQPCGTPQQRQQRRQRRACPAPAMPTISPNKANAPAVRAIVQNKANTRARASAGVAIPGATPVRMAPRQPRDDAARLIRALAGSKTGPPRAAAALTAGRWNAGASAAA